VIVVLKLKCDARAPDQSIPYVSRCADFALLVPNPLPSGELLPKLAGFAACQQQHVRDAALLILEAEKARPFFLRLASKLRQQRLDPRDVVEPRAS
jgi:hypothetical protein